MKHEYLPEDWRWIKLGDVLEQKYRQEKLQDGVDYTTLGVRWYGGGTFIKQERDGDDISSAYLNRVEEGDFIYNRLFAWKGSFAVVPAEHAGYYVSNEFPLFKIKVPDQLDLEYLLWYTKRAHFWEYIATLSTGTSNASRLRYKEEDLLRESIPLPPIDEQRRIAEVLHDADANIASVEAQIETVQEVKRGVIQRLFTYGLAGEGTPTKQTRIGEIPEHWHLSEVGKEFDVTSGFTFGPDRHPLQNKYKYLRVANVQREFINLDVLAELEATPDEIAAKSLLEGDILAVEGHANPLEIGRCALVTSDAVGLTFQNHLFRLRSRTLEPRYAIAWLNSTWMRTYWERHSRTSSGLHTINRSMLNKVPFPVPTREEQREIAEILSTHDMVIRRLHTEVASLREIKRGLMQKLLSGMVRL